VKGVIAFIILINISHCRNKETMRCKKEFFECARTCGDICDRTINSGHEFGKCFSICNAPCRKEYCVKIKNDKQ